MTMAATILAATPAYAGQWMQDGNGWWWRNDDGSYPTAQWQWIDGDADGISERYYFNENGYILANTLTPDGNQVNADGAWIVNGSVQHQNESASLPISSMQSNAGDLYYTGLRQALDSIPLYPMETTGSEELDRVLNIIFSQIITEDMDTHDKLKACYDYIIQNTEYVAPACGGEPYYSAYGHTVWCGIVPDLAGEKARKIWMDKLEQEHVNIGVSGYKVDEVDGYDRYVWPDVATFPSGIAAEQMRQTYGLWVQRTTAELYKKRNQRTFGLVRASNAGATSFPYVIYNDYYSHPDFITALINSGFSGVLWTPEVRSSSSSEDWLRRFQSVVFSPMAMINAWASGTKPWTFPEVENQIKEYAMLRMQMMPYWYSEFARYHFDGIPPFRAMNLEPGFNPEQGTTAKLSDANLEDNPYLEAVSKEIKDQYMAGEYLLVAPMFKGQKERTVVLPKGDWYDFYTGKYVGNGEKITVTPGLDRIPVYVKDGAILPFMEARLHAPKAGEKVNLEIRHYGKADGAYRLYDDDGETFDYEKGAYSWRDITVTRDKKGKLKGAISKAEKGKPNSIANVTWKFMTKE